MLHNLFRLICGIIIFGCVALFVTLNKHLTRISFWPSQQGLELETWVLILGSVAVGLVIGAGIFWIRILFYKSHIWRLKRQINTLSQSAEPSEQRRQLT